MEKRTFRQLQEEFALRWIKSGSDRQMDLALRFLREAYTMGRAHGSNQPVGQLVLMKTARRVS